MLRYLFTFFAFCIHFGKIFLEHPGKRSKVAKSIVLPVFSLGLFAELIVLLYIVVKSILVCMTMLRELQYLLALDGTSRVE